MEWWVWLIIVWAAFGCGEGCRRTIWAPSRRRRAVGDSSQRPERIIAPAHGPGDPVWSATRDPVSEPRDVVPVDRERVPVARQASRDSPPSPETPFETLQREFVDGVITMEEYERGLDRLSPRDLP